MDRDDQLTSDILAALACQPFEKQAEAMSVAISAALKYMSSGRLRIARERIRFDLDESLPAVRHIVEMIDGQLALREIAGGAYWR
jgi:hypothetical protein